MVVSESDHDPYRRGVRLVADALGVGVRRVDAALAPLRGAVRGEEEPAVGILRRALREHGVDVVSVMPGRPLVVEVEARRPVAFGEGVSVGELIEDPSFQPWILEPGRRARAACYQSAKRLAGLAMFTVRPPGRARFEAAFLVLVVEARVWQINGAELAYAKGDLESGAAWHRVRLLKSGALRMELPQGGSDWDLAYRVGPPPTRRRKK